MGNNDAFVLILVVIVLAIWLWKRFSRWLHTPMKIKLPVPDETEWAVSPEGEAAALLKEAGYEVISGKYKIPIYVEMDRQEFSSRYFIDYFARQGHEVFVVKVARDRQPVQWTGSGIRDKLLPYFLLFEEVSGVLYVDLKERKVRRIRIVLDLEARENEA
ncbi:hypothetical protein [Ferviditalea candida]|uniref:DUF2726 domain-containing protein n=1 Tax=Ferviditalea candida TaxID=3108399 RepID=A0ABU5ZIB9_9BACL|nr:hypothetical protein [Paenibacillaceae bacterium T2]